jgi:hypothetical protein
MSGDLKQKLCGLVTVKANWGIEQQQPASASHCPGPELMIG